MEQERERELAKAVGAAIARARVAAGLTQDELAEALQIGSMAVSRLERGAVMASLPRLIEIAGVVQQPVETLLRRASDLDADYAASIATILAPLRKSDKDLMIELIEKLALRFQEEIK